MLKESYRGEIHVEKASKAWWEGVHVISAVVCTLFYCIFVLCPALHNVFHTPIARYGLFMLKVPLNTKSADVQVSARSGTRPPVALLHVTDLRSWPSSVTFIWRKQTAGTTWSCTTSFGLRSFGSSGPTAWNDMPAHLRNLDLPLSDFRQLLKTTLFQTVPV